MNELEIALRYSDSILTDLTYIEKTENQEIIECLMLKPIPIMESETKTLLNGKKIKFTKSKRYKYILKMSSDILSTSTLEFLDAFYFAPYKYIRIADNDEYKEVIIENDELQRTYIDDLLYLPEIDLELIEVEARC